MSILSRIGLDMFEAVWMTRTPPMNREITPTMTMDDRISLSISSMTCLRIIFLLSGLRNTCLRKMQYFPIELKILAAILFRYYLPARRFLPILRNYATFGRILNIPMRILNFPDGITA